MYNQATESAPPASQHCADIFQENSIDSAQSISYETIEACGQSADWIIDLAAALAKELNFNQKESTDCDMNTVVRTLGGEVSYVYPDTIFPNKARITVHGVEQRPYFTIEIDTFALPPENRYYIAHEVGHYMLHSDFGKRLIRGGQSLLQADERIEQEAHCFASAFLMPPTAATKDSETQTDDIYDDAFLIASHFNVPYAHAQTWKEFLQEQRRGVQK